MKKFAELFRFAGVLICYLFFMVLLNHTAKIAFQIDDYIIAVCCFLFGYGVARSLRD